MCINYSTGCGEGIMAAEVSIIRGDTEQPRKYSRGQVFGFPWNHPCGHTCATNRTSMAGGVLHQLGCTLFLSARSNRDVAGLKPEDPYESKEH